MNIIRDLYHTIRYERHLLRDKQYLIYYCNLWCFLTNQRFCNGSDPT